MKPLISVIIPVYNVEKYLRQCLDSVIGQTYNNLEIICVNDCSTDLSPEILEEYANKDSRIVILNNTQNLGLGLTRNEGIKIAKGDFIHCLDSDDWMELNAYETLAGYFDNDVDAVKFTYTSWDETTGKNELIGQSDNDFLNKKTNIYNTPECFKLWQSSAWTKIYSRDFIFTNDLFYNDYRCFEDVEYAMRAALNAKNIIFINDSLLNYRAHRKGSLLSKRNHYINNLTKDTIRANSNTKNLPEAVRKEILDYIYGHLIVNSLDSYYANVLPYRQMRDTFIKHIDLNIISIPYLRKIAEKVVNNNQLKFFCSYNIRRFIKEHLPELTEKYLAIKKKLFQTN